jgi:SAM-dependent methyltransferase
MSQNLHYRTAKLSAYFSRHRGRWDQFYPSERWVFDRVIESGGFGHVLDVGCATGGLGSALCERRVLRSYTGIDINEEAIDAASARPALVVPTRFICGDILERGDLGHDAFDTVVSLSCADWNVETKRILDRCWSLVAPGGRFVLSLRLSRGKSIHALADSYQFLSFDDEPTGREERAPYVVFNSFDALRLLTGFDPPPSLVLGYGYWGKPSSSARTPVTELVFAVFAVTKAVGGEDTSLHVDLHLPRGVWSSDVAGA